MRNLATEKSFPWNIKSISFKNQSIFMFRIHAFFWYKAWMPSSDNWLTASELLTPSLLFLIKTKSIINLSGHKHYITNMSPTANYWICSVKGVFQLKHFWDPLLWLRFCSDNISCREKVSCLYLLFTKKFKSRQNIFLFTKKWSTYIMVMISNKSPSHSLFLEESFLH